MLAVSRQLNPDCEHVEGDMRSIRLGREFDRVAIHDAICYMTTLEDLERAIQTAWVHCRPGGAALFAPDCVLETFQPSEDCGGSDRGGRESGGRESGRRGIRYLEWVHPIEAGATSYCVDYVCVLRDEDGSVRVEHDRHSEGVFPRAAWIGILERTGFEARVIPFEHSEAGALEVFTGARPAR